MTSSEVGLWWSSVSVRDSFRTRGDQFRVSFPTGLLFSFGKTVMGGIGSFSDHPDCLGRSGWTSETRRLRLTHELERPDHPTRELDPRLGDKGTVPFGFTHLCFFY